MLFNVDSHYLIGSAHSVCEDYAIHTNFGKTRSVPVAIIADGCSQSKDSDIGARIMAHFVKKQAKTEFIIRDNKTRLFVDESFNSFVENMPYCVLNNYLYDMNNNLDASEEYLDSTVWLVGADQTENGHIGASICGWGDGAAIIKRKSGITFYCVTYESGAPFYLSYYLNSKRRERYKDCFSNTYTMSTLKIGPETYDLTNEELPYDKPFSIQIIDNTDDPIISISICSDGYKTYTNCPFGFLGSLEWAVTRMIDYPTVEGVFVERSMRFLEKQDLKNQTHHLDDISMASIAFIK